MRNLIEQLGQDKRSLLLLMYESGELSAGERAQVERMLAGDETLQRELDELRGAQRSIDAALAQLDGAQPVTGSPAAAARQFARAARQWHIDRSERESRFEPQRQLRFPWWSYPLTTAAAITIAAVVWWWTLPPAPTQLDPARPVVENSDEVPRFAAVVQLESMAELSPELADAERELREIEIIRESWQ